MTWRYQTAKQFRRCV